MQKRPDHHPAKYKRPRLARQKRRWEIVYYLHDRETGKARRVRLKVPSGLPVREAERWAAEAMQYINAEMDEGHVYYKPPTPEVVEQPVPTWSQFVDDFEQMKIARLKATSSKEYKTFARRVREYLVKNPAHDLPIDQLGTLHARGFMDYVMAADINNTTANNMLRRLRALFNEAIRQEYIVRNPAQNVQRMAETETRYNPYTPELAKRIWEYLRAEDPAMLLIVGLIYYAFLRPRDCLALKGEHLRNGRLMIPPELTKNRRNEAVKIVPALQDLLDELAGDVREDYYLVGRGMRSARAPVTYNTINRRYNLHLEALGLDTKKYQLYAWKHTGAIAASMAGTPPLVLMRHLRHKDLTTTTTYLRKLGVDYEKNMGSAGWEI